MTSLMRREEGREVRHPFVLEVEGVVEVGIFDILKIESKKLNLCFSQKNLQWINLQKFTCQIKSKQ